MPNCNSREDTEAMIVLIYAYKYINYFLFETTSYYPYSPTSPLGQDMIQGQFLSGV